jgi:hypothetical protein
MSISNNSDQKLDILVEQVGRITEGLTEIRVTLQEQVEVGKKQDERLARFGERLDQFGERLDRIAERQDRQAETTDRQVQITDRLTRIVENLLQRPIE